MDTVLLFSSRHGFWSTEHGWVKDVSDAEFLLSESSIVVRFKNIRDICTVKLSQCKCYLPFEFMDMADKMMVLPEHQAMKLAVEQKLGRDRRAKGSRLDESEKFRVYMDVVPSHINCHAVVGKNNMVTLFDKSHCQPATKAPLVGPFIPPRIHGKSKTNAARKRYKAKQSS